MGDTTERGCFKLPGSVVERLHTLWYNFKGKKEKKIKGERRQEGS